MCILWWVSYSYDFLPSQTCTNIHNCNCYLRRVTGWEDYYKTLPVRKRRGGTVTPNFATDTSITLLPGVGECGTTTSLPGHKRKTPLNIKRKVRGNSNWLFIPVFVGHCRRLLSPLSKNPNKIISLNRLLDDISIWVFNTRRLFRSTVPLLCIALGSHTIEVVVTLSWSTLLLFVLNPDMVQRLER